MQSATKKKQGFDGSKAVTNSTGGSLWHSFEKKTKTKLKIFQCFSCMGGLFNKPWRKDKVKKLKIKWNDGDDGYYMAYRSMNLIDINLKQICPLLFLHDIYDEVYEHL